MQFLKTSMLTLLMSNPQLVCMEVEVYSPSAYSPADFTVAFLKLDKDNQTKAYAALDGRRAVCSLLASQAIDPDAVARIWKCVGETDNEYLDNSPARKFLLRTGLMNAGQVVSHPALSSYLSSLKTALEVMPLCEQQCKDVTSKEVKDERKFNKIRRAQSRLLAEKQGAAVIASIPSSDIF